jgi:hypothetical protein
MSPHAAPEAAVLRGPATAISPSAIGAESAICLQPGDQELQALSL